MNQSTNQSTSQPIDQSINHSINQSKKPISQSESQSTIEFSALQSRYYKSIKCMIEKAFSRIFKQGSHFRSKIRLHILCSLVLTLSQMTNFRLF